MDMCRFMLLLNSISLQNTQTTKSKYHVIQIEYKFNIMDDIYITFKDTKIEEKINLSIYENKIINFCMQSCSGL